LKRNIRGFAGLDFATALQNPMLAEGSEKTETQISVSVLEQLFKALRPEAGMSALDYSG